MECADYPRMTKRVVQLFWLYAWRRWGTRGTGKRIRSFIFTPRSMCNVKAIVGDFDSPSLSFIFYWSSASNVKAPTSDPLSIKSEHCEENIFTSELIQLYRIPLLPRMSGFSRYAKGFWRKVIMSQERQYQTPLSQQWEDSGAQQLWWLPFLAHISVI